MRYQWNVVPMEWDTNGIRYQREHCVGYLRRGNLRTWVMWEFFFILIPVCCNSGYILVWMHCGEIWLLCVCFQSDLTIVWVLLCVHRVGCRSGWFFFCLNAFIWAVYIFPGVYVVPTRLHPYVNLTWMHQMNEMCLAMELPLHCVHQYIFLISPVAPVCMMPACCGNVPCGDQIMAYWRFTSCYIFTTRSSSVSTRLFCECVCGKRKIVFWQIYHISHQLSWCGLVDMADCVSGWEFTKRHRNPKWPINKYT